MLDPRITFLNHGSFGAVPRPVFDAQTEWRRRIEAEPIELISPSRRGTELLEQVKTAVGSFLNMRPDDFGLVTNATDGINAVLRSLRFAPGDELLTTTHVYNAVRQAMKYAAGQQGAAYREVHVPLPVQSSEQIAGIVLGSLSSRTRLLVIDHVTSPTALIFPVQRIAAECAARGVEVLIDGAHAPGMLDLDVPATGATYYAGNLHKWCCAPKGSGFLWVHPSRQRDIHPLIVSHHLGEGFVPEFGWQGTRDLSAWLTIPTALEYMALIGWADIRQHNNRLARWAHTLLAERLQVPLLSPADGSLLGSMATVPLPKPLHSVTEQEAHALQRNIYHKQQLEVPFMKWEGKNYLRVCAQVYNSPEQYERTAELIQRLARSETSHMSHP